MMAGADLRSRGAGWPLAILLLVALLARGLALWAAADAKPVIHLLPALPDAWPHGEIRGWRARGGWSVDMNWRDGELVEAVLHSRLARPVKVCYGAKTVDLKGTEDREYRLDASLRQMRSSPVGVPK